MYLCTSKINTFSKSINIIYTIYYYYIMIIHVRIFKDITIKIYQKVLIDRD